MISKSKIQWINGLRLKKEREQNSLYTAEGSRIVLDILQSAAKSCHSIYCSASWFQEHEAKLSFFLDKLHIVDESVLKKIASLQTTKQVLAIFQINKISEDITIPSFSLYLDAIRDPGNFGTILRIADWYGIQKIYGSHDCVDTYNNKVIQTSMSSIARVKFQNMEFTELLAAAPHHTFYATSMNGEDHHHVEISNESILCIGNEAHGISDLILNKCHKQISISSSFTLGAESLNAAIACGILVDRFIHKNSFK